MPPIGPQSEGAIPTLVWPEWSTIIGRQQIGKWPHDFTSRSDARLRWRSDSDLRPNASKFYARRADEDEHGENFRSQWFWFELEYEGDGPTFTAESGKDGNTDFTFRIGFKEELDIAGSPGWFCEIELRCDDADPGIQYQERPLSVGDSNYDENYFDHIFDTTLPSSFPFGHPNPWPVREIQWWPISECFPFDQVFQSNEPTGGETVEFPFNAVRVRPNTSGQTFTIPGYLTFASADYDYGGWWQPSVSTKKVFVPAGVRWVRGSACCQFINSLNAVAMNIDKNSGGFNGRPIVQEDPHANIPRRLSLSMGWVKVNAGDDFQLGIGGTASTTDANFQSQWLFIEGAKIPFCDVARQLVDFGVPCTTTSAIVTYLIIPQEAEGMKLVDVVIAFGQSASSSSPTVYKVELLDAVTHAATDFLTTDVTIEAGDFTNRTATVPFAIDASHPNVVAGDIIRITRLNGAVGAKGLFASCRFEAED